MANEHEKITNTLDRMSSYVASKAAKPQHGTRKDKMTQLSTKLGEAKIQWEKLKDVSAKGQASDKKDYDKFQSELLKGLPEIEKGVVDVLNAFEQGDELGEAESIINMCSTLVTTLGNMAGPEGEAVAGLLNALFGAVTAIMGMFEPKKPSLLDQIGILLKQEQAKQELGDLQVALGNFDALEEAWRAGLWRDVNLQDGPEVQRVRKACAWLADESNQKEELRTLWLQVLETQCRVFIETVKAVPLALEALNKQPIAPYSKHNSGGLLSLGLKTTQRMQLEFLKKIVPVLQERGIFWYLGTNGAFYCANYCTDYHGKPNPPFRALGNGVQRRTSIAISGADKGKANPRIHVFALGDGRIRHGRMTWPSGGLEEFRDLPVEQVADCSDIWATYGASNPEDPEKIYFYTAHGGKELRGYVLGYNNDKGESKIAWREPVDKVTSIRVVHFPKSVEGDPDENPENPRVLDDIAWIVYGGCKSTSRIFVMSSDGRKGFISAQDPERWGSDTYDIIAVDHHHLWISAPPGYGAYVATHTSVLRCLRDAKQPSRPSWFVGVESTDLSPCEDKTVFRLGRTRVSFKPYRIAPPEDGMKAIILRDNWTDLADEGIQVQKLPHHDWPLIGGMISSLEKGAKKAIAAGT